MRGPRLDAAMQEHRTLGPHVPNYQAVYIALKRRSWFPDMQCCTPDEIPPLRNPKPDGNIVERALLKAGESGVRAPDLRGRKEADRQFADANPEVRAARQ